MPTATKPTTQHIKTAFEKYLAEEMDGWMWNMTTPVEYVMKRIVNGDVDENIKPYSDEAAPFIKELADAFVDANIKRYPELDQTNHEEGVATAIHAAKALMSGSPGQIEEQLLVYLSEAHDNGKFGILTYERVADVYKGKFVEAAKALANAVVIFGNRKLPYPHS